MFDQSFSFIHNLYILFYQFANTIKNVAYFSTVRDLLHHFRDAADSLIRTAHLEKAKSTAVNEAYGFLSQLLTIYRILQTFSSGALVSRMI